MPQPLLLVDVVLLLMWAQKVQLVHSHALEILRPQHVDWHL